MIEVAHIDPLWFWTLYLVNTVLGSIMPPMGIFLFTLKGAAKDTSLREVYAAAWPFVILIAIGMVLMIAFPGLATWTGRFY
jgi:TRAP-type C4-dicarboxylate transport system permease large subunit